MLASLGLFSSLVVIVGILLGADIALHSHDFWLLSAATIWLTFLYRITRVTYHGIAIRLVVITLTIVAFGLSHPVDNQATLTPHIFLIIPVLISSILLPVHETLLVISIHTLGMVAYPRLYSGVPWDNSAVLPIVLTSLMVMITFHYVLTVERRQYTVLQDNAAQTAAILTVFPDIIFRIRADGVFLEYHAGKNAELYRPPEEFLHKTVAEVLPQDHAARVMSKIRRTLTTRSPQAIIYSLPINGEERWYEARSVPYTADTVLSIVRDVSDTQRSMRALEGSEKTYNALMQALPDLIFRIDRHGKILDLNPKKLDMVWTDEVNQGDNLHDVLPQFADQVLAAVERALTQNTPQLLEFRLPVNHTPHIYEVRITASGPDDVIAIARDVTEQRRGQNQLRESEARYRALFEDSPISLWEEDFSAVKKYIDTLRASGVTDLANYFFQHPDAIVRCSNLVRILNVNQATRDLMGVEVKDTLLDTLGPLFNTKWQRSLSREIVSFARGITRFSSETIQTEVNHQKRYLSITSTIAPGYEDTWERVYVSVADITERVNVEEALATSERQLELALEGVELGLWDWNLRTNALGVNTWWAKMIGYAVQDLTPHISTWDNALHPDDRERVWAAFHAHQDRVTPYYEVEYRMRARNNSWIWVMDRGKIVERDQDGVALRIVGTHLDITNRKKVEEAEREQRALSEALHDIATVLSSTLDLNEVLDHILTSIGHVVPYDAASIALIENNEARIVRSQGFVDADNNSTVDDLRMPIKDYPTLTYMVEKRTPLIINDIQTDPQWVPIEATLQMSSYIGAPICWDEETVGFLGLQSTTTAFYTHIHSERMHAFAAQAAIALRNAKWYETAQRRLDEMEALHSTMLEITSQLQLDELLKLLLEHALRIIDAHSGGIYLYVPEDDELEWVINVGENETPVGSRLKRGEGMSGHVLEHNSPLIINDHHQNNRPDAALDIHEAASMVAVPINWQGRLLGVINATAPTTNTFTDHDLQVLNLFANQAAIAIQNARLFDAEFQQRVLSETLSHTAAVINSTLDLDDILNTLLLAVERVLPYEAANILLIEGDYAYVAYHRGYEVHDTSDYMDALRVDITSWKTIKHLTTTNTGMVISNTATDPNWVHHDRSAWIRSQMSVPIRVENRVIGALNLDSSQLNTFMPSDIDRVQAFADQTALAINNARLYSEVRSHRDQLEQRVQERTRDLSVRNAIAETLSSSLDTGEMLNGVLRVVTAQLHITGSAIYLPDSPHQTQILVASHGSIPDTLKEVVMLPEDDTIVWNNPADTFAPHSDIPSMLSVPIWQKEQVEGAIVLIHNAARPWTESEKSMLDAIGRQIGVALANARSYDSAVQGEARIRTILESVTDGLMVFDKTDQLLLLNPAAREMFNFYDTAQGGANRAASLLWRWLRAYEVDFPNRSRIEFALPATPLNTSALDAIRGACETKPCRLPHNHKPGWPCWLYPRNLRPEESKQCLLYNQTRQLAIQAQSAIVRDDSGEILGTVIVLNDVTHFRELDELKGRFVSTVSHELRTPLSTILLQVSMLLKYYDRFENSERLTMIQEIQEQSQVLRTLIEDILELSRFDDNRSLPQKQWFDMVTASNDVLSSMELNIRDKAITIDSTSCTGSRYIMGDPNQIKRVLRNLINNAMKYTPPGGSISVSLREEDAHIVLSVTDTGIGIAQDDKEYIFDRFYRAKEAINMASGTGLGLSITKEIIDLHDGQITVTSQPGEGSTFTVYLPIGGIDRVR